MTSNVCTNSVLLHCGPVPGGLAPDAQQPKEEMQLESRKAAAHVLARSISSCVLCLHLAAWQFSGPCAWRSCCTTGTAVSLPRLRSDAVWQPPPWAAHQPADCCCRSGSEAQRTPSGRLTEQQEGGDGNGSGDGFEAGHILEIARDPKSGCVQAWSQAHCARRP